MEQHYLFSTFFSHRWVDQYGADKLVKKMEEYQGLYGAPFKPAQTLVDMAKDSSKKFHKQN